jgi:hypothetical protein
MKITTETQTTREQRMSNVEAMKAKIASSTFYKIANDATERTSRRQEAQHWVNMQNAQVEQELDGAMHTPTEAYTLIMVTDCYNERETLKANGYRWNSDSRFWGKRVLTANVAAEIAKISK